MVRLILLACQEQGLVLIDLHLHTSMKRDPCGTDFSFIDHNSVLSAVHQSQRSNIPAFSEEESYCGDTGRRP